MIAGPGQPREERGKGGGFVLRALAIELRREGGELVTTVILDQRFDGRPHVVHGGAIAALFDEVLGAAAVLELPAVVTARLEIDFRRPLPVGLAAELRASARRVGGRKIEARGTLRAAETAELIAQARGLWVAPDGEL